MLTKKPFLPTLFAFVAICGLLAFANHSLSIATAEETPVAEDEKPSPDDVTLTPDTENTVDVKAMLRAACNAGTKIKDEQAIGGFAPSDNQPRSITSEEALATEDCYLLAQPTVETEYNGDKGMRLVLVNATEDTVAFRACDSRMSIIQEAKDADGNWQPIEALPSSRCGNSYHRVMLGAGEYWAFATPRYSGTIPTTLRFRLSVPRENIEILSNEFKGSVNPEQFPSTE